MMTDNYLQMMIESLVMKRDILQQISEFNISQYNMATMDKSSFNDSEFYSNGDNKSAYAAQIKELQGLIKEITDLSVKVQAQESRNKVIVGRKFNQMKADIQNAKRSSKMANAYHKVQSNLGYTSQFMDRKK